MTIDKQKLQKLLWAEAASYRADCAGWKLNADALAEFLGDKTLEEVALELLAENGRLRADLDGEISQAREFNVEHEEFKHERDQLKADNEVLRKECDRLAEDKQGLLEDCAGPL